MARYEFDRLGWLNFEWLVQTWLKAEFGFTVESWGGYRDRGRDAYSATTVSGRSTNTHLGGPVVFQAKFVSSASARGSDYKSPLLKACAAEARAIRERADQGLWEEPATYVLITNCPITADDRIAIEAALSTCTLAKVITLGSEDLAATIDLRPEIARAFPQILSYPNLVDIINKTQAKEVLERSAAALTGAQDVIPVFVPTEAYNRAWQVLRNKYFVVLSGPPEMGQDCDRLDDSDVPSCQRLASNRMFLSG
jgi:hypothetical protein